MKLATQYPLTDFTIQRAVPAPQAESIAHRPPWPLWLRQILPRRAGETRHGPCVFSAAALKFRRRKPAGGSFLLLLIVSFAFVGSCTPLYDKLGGDFAGGPEELAESISADAEALIAQAFGDVDASRLMDFHVHILGFGTGGTGAFVNPRMRSWWHPMDYLRSAVYMSAAGISVEARADSEYIERLENLIRHSPQGGRYALMAFDKHYRPDGTVNLERTQFHVPNDYVYRLASANPAVFVPMVSVHPYRDDALQALRKWAGRGVRLVKWLPSAMGIDPSNERIDPYYRLMRQFDMVLLTHIGEEQAVDVAGSQQYGNPLLLRRPLEIGVKVIMAHSGSLGQNVDIESPGQKRVSSFALFLRMMEEPKYEGLLFGEISGLTQYNRFDGPLQTLLERTDLHHRLVNGSDYPLPAVNFIIHTGELADAGLITEVEKNALNEIYRYNPLLFDYVVKRTVHHPRSCTRFPPEVFTSPFDLD